MPLQKTKGNMYAWVSHTHAHLGGECPHECVYCYVENPRFGRPERYRGPLRLIEEEFSVRYGAGKVIFIEHCNDLFADQVPQEFIARILSHCLQYPTNVYVFQSKAPYRFLTIADAWPSLTILGTTIETNRDIPGISNAPTVLSRLRAMEAINRRRFKTFITIEPVLDFDVAILASWIDRIRPDFLNLGADSKGHGLPEPTIDKIESLVGKLKEYGIELREKHNLQRLRKGVLT